MREQDRPKTSAWRRLRCAWGEFKGDRDGSALLYTTLSLPVLIGFALLAIDGSRLMNLNSSLQNAADGLALAAAGELNHKDDSLERAKLAIQELIQNDQRFGDAGLETVECPTDADCDVTGRFLTSLPPDDATPISDWIAGDSSRLVANLSDNLVNHPRATSARFIEITVKPQGFSTLIPASFVGGSNTASTSAAAVAGYTRGVCYFTPLMMCNPFEDDDPDTPDLYEVAATPEFRRRMVELRQVGPGADYFPGNFAFLRNESMGSGANALRDSLAMVDPGTCFNEDGVDTEPGQNMGPVQQGLNVRFDIYTGPMNGKRTDAAYRPSMNVRKGYGGASCPLADMNDGASYQGLPRDQTVQTELQGGRIYTGEWDGLAGQFEQYWQVNFGHAGIAAPNGWDNSDANRPSRYEVYRYEIENSPTLTDDPSVGGETGGAMCYTGGALSDDPDRRILHAAVVNCGAEGPLNGQEDDIPVYAFAKFFLIRPLNESGTDTIDVEIVEVVAPPTDYQARDTVQLYR